MSEALRISSEDIKDWLRRETSSTLIPVREEAEKLVDEMEGELEEMIDISKLLFENSKKEIEKRSKKTLGRARALNKLARLFIKRIQQIEIPEEVSYDSFHLFVRETRKAFVATEVDIKNWFSRISPYFILDRRKFETAFDKAKERLKELHSFLKEDYDKTKTIEETFHLIENLLSQEAELAKLKARNSETETRRSSIEEEIDEVRKKKEDLKDQERLAEIRQIKKEIRKLRREVKRRLRHLQKPFMKFQRLVFRKGGLTPKESKKLRDYVRDPFKAFATEEEGFPHLKRILQEIDGALSNGRLNLKSSRRRKAKEDIDNILNKKSLDSLHQKCREAVTRKKRLSTSTESEKMKKNMKKLRKELRRLRRRKKRVELEENRIEQDLKETLEKINNQKDKIEKNISDFLGKRILVELKVQ